MQTVELQTGTVAESVEAMPPTTFSETTGLLGEDRLRQVIDTALDGMVVIDSSGTVLLYNAACERLFGYSAQEILGKNVNLLMPTRIAGITTPTYRIICAQVRRRS